MKIAVWHNLLSGGAKRALYYQVRGLSRRGHQLSCWSLDNADHSYLPLSEFANERIVASGSNHNQRKRIRDRWTFSYNEALRKMQAFDEACRQCAIEIESGDFDLLFANSALDYNVPYILRHSRLKKLLYLQEPCRYFYEARPLLPWVSGTPDDLHSRLFAPRRLMANYANMETLRIRAKQEWLSAHACDSLLVNSYFSRESIFRSYGVDSKVCYLGIDTHLFQNLGLERERLLVGLGSFHQIKGIDLAVKAVSLLEKPRPPLVWIANSGNESYEAEIRGLAQSLDVDLRIKFRVSDAELVTILNKATLLLYTSRLEPFGFAPLEANACGLPVVGIAEGGIRETVKDGINGLLVDPDPESISSAVRRLLDDDGLTRRMGEQAVLHVQRHWNLEDSIDRLERLMLSLTQNSNGMN